MFFLLKLLTWKISGKLRKKIYRKIPAQKKDVQYKDNEVKKKFFFQISEKFTESVIKVVQKRVSCI